jgi:hypothetical protein
MTFCSSFDISSVAIQQRSAEDVLAGEMLVARIGFHRMNYGVHEPMSAAMREFNEVIGLFGFILARSQFLNRLEQTL